MGHCESLITREVDDGSRFDGVECGVLDQTATVAIMLNQAVQESDRCDRLFLRDLFSTLRLISVTHSSEEIKIRRRCREPP
jgi:hypothetical protein